MVQYNDLLGCVAIHVRVIESHYTAHAHPIGTSQLPSHRLLALYDALRRGGLQDLGVSGVVSGLGGGAHAQWTALLLHSHLVNRNGYAAYKCLLCKYSINIPLPAISPELMPSTPS
jgi:hypothetical protein